MSNQDYAINDLLVEMFNEQGIDYNGTIVFKIAQYIEDMIESGELANPCPDYADNFKV